MAGVSGQWMLITSAVRSTASRSARLLLDVMPMTSMSNAAADLASRFPEHRQRNLRLDPGMRI